MELKSEANDAADSSAKEEKGEEKPDSKGTVTGERQSGDGQVSPHQRPPFGAGRGAFSFRESKEPFVLQESTEPMENKVPKHLDDDEDRKNPAYIPRKGLFFEHDLRGQTQEEEVR